MSEGRPSKEKESSGLGLTAGILLAGGAAVAGFLASQLWNEHNRSSGSGTPPRPSHPSRPTGWDENPKARKESRQKMRQGSVEGKNEEIPAGLNCIICYDNPREVIIEPCNHVCVCEDCAAKMGSLCPVCRNGVAKKRAVYL